MLLSGAFLLALALLGIVLATTGAGHPADTQATAGQPPATQVRASASTKRERERMQPCGG